MGIVFNRKDKHRIKEERKLSKLEKIEFNHLSSVSEAKKGLQRISFNAKGELDNIEFSFTYKILTYFLFISPIILFLFFNIYSLVKSILDRKLIYYKDFIVFSIWYFILGFIVLCIISKLHLRDLFDDSFDGFKKFYNSIIFFLNNNEFTKDYLKVSIPDSYKLNIKVYTIIGDQKTCRRAGLPILTYRCRVYVDSGDSHSLIIGTTNSGKTFSLIHIYIQLCKMAGESMLINDLKGELYKIHKQSLIDAGYKVRVINFVEPHKSEAWNPFALVVKKYRQAQRNYHEENKDNKDYQEKLKLEKEIFLIVDEINSQEKCVNEILNQLSNTKDENVSKMLKISLEVELKKLNEVKLKLEGIKQRIKSIEDSLEIPNFNEAYELLRDITRIFCTDVKAKDPYWTNKSAEILEAFITFLLEEKTINENGELVNLPDEMINIKSVRALEQDGKVVLSVDHKSKKVKTVLSDYIEKYKKPSDESVRRLSSYLDIPIETRESVISTFIEKISILLVNDSIARMTSYNTFDFELYKNEKTAVFMIVHDEKKTYYQLVTIFVKQFYEEIIKIARQTDNLRLKIPVNVIYDEFGISPALNDIISILGASRSRGVRFNMVVQDTSQIDDNYGKEVAQSIRNNVMNYVYILGGDIKTLKEVSERAGKKMKWNKEKSQFESVPVISTERLARLSLGEVLVLRQRKQPLITRYYPYDKYIFNKGKIKADGVAEEKKLPKVKCFDIGEEIRKKYSFGKIKDENIKEYSIDEETGEVLENKAEDTRVVVY